MNKPTAGPASEPTLVDRMHRFWNLESNGRHDEAVDELKGAHKLYPNLVAELRSAIQRHPQDAELHFCLAPLLYRPEQAAQTIEELRKGLQLKPEDAYAHYLLSLYVPDNEMLPELNEAIRLKPDLYIAHKSRASLLEEKGDLNGATSDVLAAIRLNPKQAYDDSLILINDLEMKGDLNGAVTVARAAVQANPSDPRTHSRLGGYLLRERDWAGAAAEYRELIRLKPDDANQHSGLAAALAGKGDWNGAIAELREAVHLEPDTPDYHLLLAAVLKRRGDVFEAEQQEEIGKELASKARK
jgi:Flp pilus assembly protein TadD